MTLDSLLPTDCMDPLPTSAVNYLIITTSVTLNSLKIIPLLHYLMFSVQLSHHGNNNAKHEFISYFENLQIYCYAVIMKILILLQVPPIVTSEI